MDKQGYITPSQVKAASAAAQTGNFDQIHRATYAAHAKGTPWEVSNRLSREMGLPFHLADLANAVLYNRYGPVALDARQANPIPGDEGEYRGTRRNYYIPLADALKTIRNKVGRDPKQFLRDIGLKVDPDPPKTPVYKEGETFLDVTEKRSGGKWQAALDKTDLMLGQMIEGGRQSSSEVAGVLLEAKKKAWPNGLTPEVRDKLAQMMGGWNKDQARLMKKVLHNLDPTQTFDLADLLLKKKGPQKIVQGYKDLFKRVAAGDTEAEEDLIAMIIAAEVSTIGGIVTKSFLRLPGVPEGPNVRPKFFTSTSGFKRVLTLEEVLARENAIKRISFGETDHLPRSAASKFATAEELFEAGKQSREPFKSLLTRVVSRLEGTVIDAPTQEILNEVKIKRTKGRSVGLIAPTKTLERAARKVKLDVGWERVNDITRGTLYVESPDDLPLAVQSVLESLEEEGFSLASKPFNRFATPTKTGYRDVQLILRSPNGSLAELQINLKGLAEAKELSHPNYEKVGYLRDQAEKAGSNQMRDSLIREAEQVERKIKAMYDRMMKHELERRR